MKVEVNDIINRASEWMVATLQSPDTYIQTAIILIAVGIGWGVRHFISPSIKNAIDSLDWPTRLKNTLRIISRLTLHATAVLVLFVVELIDASELLDIGSTLGISAVISLLLAWIFIRVIAQIIRNSFLRQIVALFAWVVAALSILGVLDDTANTLDAAAMSVGEVRISALTIIKGLLALFVLVYAAIFLSGIIERRLQGIEALTISTRVLLGKIIRVVLITFALLTGLTTAGVDLSLLTVFSGAVGLGVGFGLQKGISNLFSGMLLLMDRSIKPGDIIELLETGTFGWVKHMGARYTEILTRDNKSFIIPNEDFITQQVVNWSHGDTLVRIQIEFGVHYNSDPHFVKEIAEKAAVTPDRVVDDPYPVAWLIEFGDSSLNFTLRFWIRDAQRGVTNIKGQVMLALWDSFQENGIQIPYPHREVFLHEDKSKQDEIEDLRDNKKEQKKKDK